MEKLKAYWGLYYAYLNYFPSCTPIINPDIDDIEQLINILKRCKENIEVKESLWNNKTGLDGSKYKHRTKINVLIYDYLKHVHDSIVT